MKYQSEALGSKAEFREYLKGVISELFASRLEVEGQTVAIPDDADLDYKVKYSADEDVCSLTIKVSWDNDTGD